MNKWFLNESLKVGVQLIYKGIMNESSNKCLRNEFKIGT